MEYNLTLVLAPRDKASVKAFKDYVMQDVKIFWPCAIFLRVLLFPKYFF